MSRRTLEWLYYGSIGAVLLISWTGAYYLHSDSGYITSLTVTALMFNKVVEHVAW